MSKNEGNASDKAAAGGVQAGNTAVPAAKKGRMARILDTIAKYTFFPEDFPCLGCGSELELDRHHLCRECARTLRPVEHCCHICGRAGKEDICSDCRGGRSFCRAVAAYNGQLQKAGVCLQIPRCNLRSRCHGAGYCLGVRFCFPRGCSNKRALKAGGHDTERIQPKPRACAARRSNTRASL